MKAIESHEVWERINAFLSMKAASSTDIYKGILKEWCDFLGALSFTREGAERFLSATELDALSYRSWLYNKVGQPPRILSSTRGKRQVRDGTQGTLTNATVAKKLTVLRRLYRVLETLPTWHGQNPFHPDRVEIPSPQSGRKRPTEMVEFSLVTKLIESPVPDSPKGLRDRAILAILFGGGLRRSEAAALRIGDLLRSDQGTTFVRLRATKARTDANQALPEWVMIYLDPYIDFRRAFGATSHHHLFISFRGVGGKTPVEKPISSGGIYDLFKKYASLLPEGNFLTPHSARATAITKLLDDGITYREVKEFSRHSTATMVEVYDKRRLGIENNPGKKLKY